MMKKWSLFIILILILVGCQDANQKHDNILLFESSAKNPLEEESNNEMLEYQSVDFKLNVNEANEDRRFNLKLMGIGTVWEDINSYEMKYNSEGFYNVTLDLPIGALVRYKYEEISEDIANMEQNYYGQNMYRQLYVEQNIEVFDMFNEVELDIDIHSIKGKVLDNNKNPLTGIIVEVDGLRTENMWDGSFEIHDLADGDKRLLVYDVENYYEPVQIRINLKDNIDVGVVDLGERREDTVVHFEVILPSETPELALVKVAGLSSQFGFKYFQLNQQVFDEEAKQILWLERKEDSYIGEIRLPIGLVLPYAYTLGDGSISTESIKDKKVLRFARITEDLIIKDEVTGFELPWESLLEIKVNVPHNTPEEEGVYINFHGYKVLPLKKIDDYKWGAAFYFNHQDNINYRIVRSGSNAILSEDFGNMTYADDFTNSGFRKLDFSEDTSLDIDVEKWYEWSKKAEYNSENIVELKEQLSYKGMMIADYWTSSFSSRIDTTIQRLKDLNVNTVMISPVWNFSHLKEFPRIESQSSYLYSVNIPLLDLKTFVNSAHEEGLKVALYQQLNPEMLEHTNEDYWNMGARSDEWWDAYLVELRRFYMHYAKISNDLNIEMISLPSPFNGDVVGWFEDEEQAKKFDIFVSELIDDIREVYQGELYAPIELHGRFDYEYQYYYKLDYISNKHWYSLTNLDEMQKQFREDLRRFEYYSHLYNKPYIIDQLTFFREDLDDPVYAAAEFYDKAFEVISEFDFIEGVFGFGYPMESNMFPGEEGEKVIGRWFE